MMKIMVNVKYELLYVVKWMIVVVLFMYCLVMNFR